MNRKLARLVLAALLLGACAQSGAQHDPPLRRLQISARFEDTSRQESFQVLEGSRAVIYTAASRPRRERQYIQTPGGVVSQQVIIVQDERTGFEVVPRLAGEDEVILDLSGSKVRARLGEWVELGRIASSARYRAELQGVWVRVDEVRD